jgi:Zn-dependent protease with chaperone function
MIGISSLLHQLYDFLLYFTFPIRRWLLIALVVMSVVPGVFIFQMPFELRMAFAYPYAAIMVLGLYSVANVYASSVLQMAAMFVFGRRYKTWGYSTPEVEQLQAKMGLNGIKIFVTNNKYVRGPFTNAVTKKVYLTEKWLKENPQSEVLSTLGHEFGHVLTRRRFALEAAGAIAAVVLTSTLIALHTIAIIVQVEEFAALVLMLTWVSWRNEYRADLISARYLGPEGLISVLEQVEEEMRARKKRDQGSETHPPLKDRIVKLYSFMDGTIAVGAI